MLALSVPVCVAQVKSTSPAYSFGIDVVHCLSGCMNAMELEAEEDISLDEAAAFTQKKTNMLEDARALLVKWKGDFDSDHMPPAAIIYQSIGDQIKANNQEIEMANELKAGTLTEEDAREKADEIERLGGSAWESVYFGSNMVLWTMTKTRPGDKYKPMDKVPFAMTQEEKTALINEIDKLFSNKIALYTKKMPKQLEPENYIALTALNLKKLLRSKIFAEVGPLLEE